MRTALIFSILIALVGGCGDGCNQDPPIIIRFEPAVDGGETTTKRLDGGAAKSAADLAPKVTTQKSPPLPAKKATACKKDSDCVVEPADCCGCNQDGKQHAVHKKDVESAAQHDARCADFMCAQAVSSDASCMLRAGCLEETHVCGLVHDRHVTAAQGAPAKK